MNDNSKILVIDDSELIRVKMFYLLKMEYNESNLFFAESIDQAWTILNREAINVVLLDIYLPGKNGADLMSDMFANDKLKNIPIIVITGTKKNSFVKASFEKHVHAYLHKPIDKAELFEALNKLV